MRRTAGIIVGLVGALAAIAITAGVARYGYLNSDATIDGAIWATIFGMADCDLCLRHQLHQQPWRDVRPKRQDHGRAH